MAVKDTKKEDVRDILFYTQKNGYELADKKELTKSNKYCEGYKKYLDVARTERECVTEAIKIAEAEGYREYVVGSEIKTGDKLYYNNRGKALFLMLIGKKSLAEGTVIGAAHIDSPKIDLKQLPLFESDELAYFKTHYYGGIKKYQWAAIPLELRGVVALKDGTVVEVCIGRDKNDPQFCITDLLPHLGKDQNKKPLSEAFTGEGLNILIGSVPYADEGKDRVKLAVMSILYDSYGIVEEDFVSAELTAVPAFEVRDIGLDRSMIGGYGQDDRVCAYAALRAMLDAGVPERTCVTILADKEETGSNGTTSMQSEVFEYIMDGLCRAQGVNMAECFSKSVCISTDVTAAFDPNYPEVSEKRNASKINYGVGLCKFTGARGKSGTNDTDAEFVARLRKLFEDKGVLWQMCELGKVDQGGGGTVALLMANRNITTIDAGVPVLSMHAPFEIVSKLDCYMTYKALLAAYTDL